MVLNNMFGVVLLVLCLQTCFKSISGISQNPIVQTSYGPIRGYSFTSPWTGQEVSAFNGVPYASPPVGDLRFKAPVFPQKWSSVKDCIKEGHSCMQVFNSGYRKPAPHSNTSENCLFLNIYTPKLSVDAGLPVMVYLHGGAFIEGSGNYLLFGPDFFVAEGIVLVTLNYRLGSFGFLNLGTPDIPGNAGLKDQRLALQWVQNEIKKFGGDPGQVTLFGQSAGSTSAHLHYLSPSSKGLFHKVIGQSGTALHWSVPEHSPSTAYGLRLAALLNCSGEDLLLTESCLQGVPANNLLQAQQLVEPVENEPIYGIQLVFKPSIENSLSQNPFLPEPPRKLIENNSGSHVPFLMGINSKDGMIVLNTQNDGFIANFTNNLDRLIPFKVKNDSSQERIQQLVKDLEKFYISDLKNEHEVVKGLVDMYTDLLFGYSTAISASYFRKRSPVYLYYFAFDGRFKEKDVNFVESKYNITGVSHSEELGYMFVKSSVNQIAPPYSEEIKTWRRMIRLWTNFAKFGQPTVEADPLLQNVSWHAVGSASTPYLRIDGDLIMEAGDFLEPSVAFWDSFTSSPPTPSFQIVGAMALTSVFVLFVLLSTGLKLKRQMNRLKYDLI